jgi:hypothetical protein
MFLVKQLVFENFFSRLDVFDIFGIFIHPSLDLIRTSDGNVRDRVRKI